MRWGECEVSLLCPPGGAEPFIAIPELVDKVRVQSCYSACVMHTFMHMYFQQPCFALVCFDLYG